ncbi:MAG: hypothetical protein CVV64_09430 [Candidatus Wallbacteria bacterium HGW-Wallbacteria-1]|uniref:DUF1848 domain-containing protein n=1 Tax=Candidatus Wallbacteria bacterium HGW-Wallbacteria-1 TaxID=2013854 RepID=A0A2N1PQG9_9BACT|nr:MAG: hypothetical protein CVV64_09430 [Candidatus Wallbacteria bacterium HGW-Wallbacteria-1]
MIRNRVQGKKVISASRREDMTAFRSMELSDILMGRGKGVLSHLNGSRIHSLLLWTKDYRNLLKEPLASAAETCDQTLVMLTITGLGGTLLEPEVPDYRVLLSDLAKLAEYLKNPERIIWRYDPLITVDSIEGMSFQNNPISNLRKELFHEIASAMASVGVKKVITSIVSPYSKVLSRLGSAPGPTNEQAVAFVNDILQDCRKLGLTLSTCCSIPSHAGPCVDHRLLSFLHPGGEKAPFSSKPSQRSGCLCDSSWDIGWYRTCPHGCLYCYARPGNS